MTDTTTQAALPAPDYIDPDGGAEYWERSKMRAYATQYAASLTAERDELRARLQWHDVRTDGPPPCDGETVFDGVNSVGYPGSFNAYRAIDGDCYMETAEGAAHVMGDLRYWRRHTGPAKEGEAHV